MICWADVAEVIKAVAPAVTAGAACFGAYIAYRGLNKWHRETIGNRKIELAEEVLSAFYHARDILRWARAKGGRVEQKPGPWRHDSVERALYRDELAAVIDMLTEHNDFFGEVQARRYRFEAFFGPDAAKPFEEFGKIQMEVFNAALTLISDYHNQGIEPLAETEKLKTIVGWPSPETDPIARRIDAVVKQVEEICAPVIRKGGQK